LEAIRAARDKLKAGREEKPTNGDKDEPEVDDADLAVADPEEATASEDEDDWESDDDDEEEEEEWEEPGDEDEEEDEWPKPDPARLAEWPLYFVPRDESMMTSAMADYCIAELRHKAKEFVGSTSGAIFVFNGDVVKSDKAVSLTTKLALQKAVEPLENVAAVHKDWHPGSDGKVLDLVHPSLFPLVYGKSRVLAVEEKVVSLKDFMSRSGEGSVIPRPKRPWKETVGSSWRKESMRPFSTQFQWLPCEVDVTGDKPKYASHD
jgi:Protein of unknown function (DUF4246)